MSCHQIINPSCVICDELVPSILTTIIEKIVTKCGQYICHKCVSFKLYTRTYTLFICCNKCIDNYDHNVLFNLKFIKMINNGILYEYESVNQIDWWCNRTKLYSFIDIFEDEVKVFKNIKKKIIKQLDVHLIKDLQLIVIDYIY